LQNTIIKNLIIVFYFVGKLKISKQKKVIPKHNGMPVIYLGLNILCSLYPQPTKIFMSRTVGLKGLP